MQAPQQPARQASVDPGIFRAYDIRGVVGENLSAEVARRIGHGIASRMADGGARRIAIARDGRLSSPELAAALIEGLRAGGRDVVDIGCVPTPVLYFATFALEDLNSGIMVTGSHNPPEYNGFKVVIGGDTLFGEDITDLHRRIPEQAPEGSGSLDKVDLAARYLDAVTESIGTLARPLRVVLDAGNGVAGELAPRVFRRLGCEVEELYTEIDGRFPNHHPDPGEPENLGDLIVRVRETGADIGFGFDGDGDRVGVITPAGELIYPDHLMMAYAEDLLSREPGARILFDVKCTGNLERVIQERGGTPEMYRTGHSLIKARMRESGALLAGEMSGHIFFGEHWYGFDDGLYAAARLAAILAGAGEDADGFFARFPRDYSTPEISIPVPDERKFDVVERLARDGDFGEGRRITLDGIRVDYEDGWGLCRASNTSPKLVARYEGRTPEALERIRARFEQAIEKALAAS